jgi:hypothetical protein
MRRGHWLLLLAGVALGGCGPDLSKTDLGHVVYELPNVAGADKPYPMPQFDKSPERGATQSGKGHDGPEPISSSK